MAIIEYASTTDRDDIASLLQTISARRGSIPNVYRMLLHSPPLLEGWVHLANEVRYDSVLDGPSRELVILLVAHLTGCHYEWEHHKPLALAAGVTEQDVATIADWPNVSSLQTVDVNLARFAGAMATRTPIASMELDDWISRTDPRFVVETAMTVAYYLGLAHFILALQVDEEAPSGS